MEIKEKLTINHSDISISELKVFDSLKDIEIVFDVGARMQMDISTVPSIQDYLELKPNAIYHLFEPNKLFWKELKEKFGNKENVFINNYGLGDIEGFFEYIIPSQSFSKQVSQEENGLLVKTLEWYMQSFAIPKIDFLKIDTEGFDLKVIKGSGNFLQNIHYIQYEVWNNQQDFIDVLSPFFDIKDIGYRNYLCTNKFWNK